MGAKIITARLLLWALGFLGIGLGLVWYMSFIFLYDKSFTFVEYAMSDSMNRAILIDNIEPYTPPSFGHRACEVIDFENAKRKGLYGECYVIDTPKSSEYCEYWWLGRKCIAIGINENLYIIPNIIKILERALREPCLYSAEVYRNYLKCDVGNNQQYDVKLIIYRSPYQSDTSAALNTKAIVHFNVLEDRREGMQ